MRFFRQEYWSGLSCPPLRNLPDPGIEPWSPAFQADSLPLSRWWSPNSKYTQLERKKNLNLEFNWLKCGDAPTESLRYVRSHSLSAQKHFLRLPHGERGLLISWIQQVADGQWIPNLIFVDFAYRWYPNLLCLIGTLKNRTIRVAFKPAIVVFRTIINSTLRRLWG